MFNLRIKIVLFPAAVEYILQNGAHWAISEGEAFAATPDLVISVKCLVITSSS
jgi:hypothetical protein